jgi:UDP-N-acetylmuramoyl-tripeptide--D-alanyl-D-alanine ligase
LNTEEFYSIYLRFPQICTDSRKSKPGCLYFALRGDLFDGNAFAADSLQAGCEFAVVDDPSVAVDDRYIVVRDVLAFLQELASYHRDNLTIPVLGLTGTNGKTTTKELIHSVLKQKFRVVATQGNLNNHIGVPLTVLEAEPETEILVVEMGANHPGEIASLCSIARPDWGLITNIGKAHLEGFGSFEGVIKTKNELYEWIRKSGGQLLLNGDDDLLVKLADKYPSFRYGTLGDPDVQGYASADGRNLAVGWKSRGDEGCTTILSNLTGGYNLYNILAAVSAGVCFGLDSNQINRGIASYVPENMRSQWIDTERNAVLLDAYNANPSSMEQALNHFAGLPVDGKVVVLGDMFELGDQSNAEHLRILDLASGLGFDKVFIAGTRFGQYSAEFPYLFFETTDDLDAYLKGHPVSGKTILIKGSRGMRMERLLPNF